MSRSTDAFVHGLQSPPVHPEIAKVLKDFYVDYYDSYKARNNGTGNASGIVGLSQLLEGKDGLLDAIIQQTVFEPLFKKEKEYKDSPYSFEGRAKVIRAGNYSSILSQAVSEFQNYRNLIVHPQRYPYPEHVDAATNAFLSIVEEYYRLYSPVHIDASFYDLSVLQRQLDPGTYLLGRYEIVQYLGKSAHAFVYKVKDRVEPGRAPMAAKLFFDMSPEVKVELDRERKFGSNMKSNDSLPYINEYLGSETLGKDSEIVFRRYIEGGPLSSWFATGVEKEDFPYRLMTMVSTLLQGLRAIHEKGYVYGSLLPQNIVVDVLDQGWLIDFTRSVKAGKTMILHSKDDWKRFGLPKTPPTAQPFIDIHMLGMVLHRLLVRSETGELRLPLKLDQVCPAFKCYVSPEMIAFINRCTAEKNAEKYQTAAEALEGWNVAFEKQTAFVAERKTGPMKIGLVSCSRRKVDSEKPLPARELYSASSDFQRWLRWAEKYCDKTFIVSGKYGLVETNQYLPNYNVDLRHYPTEGQEAWARFIVHAMLNQGVSSACEVHICADSLYRSLLQGELSRHHIRVVEHEWKDETGADVGG